MNTLERCLVLSDEVGLNALKNTNEFTSDLQKSEILAFAIDILNGNYKSDYHPSIFSSIFNPLADLDAEECKNYQLVKSILSECYKKLNQTITKYLSENQEFNSFVILLCGINYLNLFIQQNFVGPTATDLQSLPFINLSEIKNPEFLEIKSDSNSCRTSTLQKYAISELSINGETAFSVTIIPHYLLIAKCFLDRDDISNLETYEWWKFRVNITHQRLMSYFTETILNSITKSFEYLDAKYPVETVTAENDELVARYYIEKGLVDYYFRRQRFAFQSFEKAKQATGLYLNVTGKFGVKTKYQQYKTAQLVLEAKSRSSKPKVTGSDLLPEVVKHYEDTHLLETPNIDLENDEEKELTLSALRPVDQAIILAMCIDIKNTNPDHGITQGQMMPYINRVIENPQNWLIQSTALLLRAKIQAETVGTLIRSIEQMEKLVSQNQAPEPNMSTRLKYFYCLGYPPIFELQRELAFIYTKSALLESALVIYRKYGMFEEMMKSFISLDQENRAKRIVIEKLIEDPENPLLWCMLGDLKRSEKLRQEYHVEGEDEILSKYPTCIAMYEKAWEVSEHRFARAKRALGFYFTEINQHENALPEFEASLALSSLYTSAWFIYGYCCMKTQNWKKAQTAYSKVVQQTPDDAEAWSNLANVHLEQGNKKGAFLAQQEAARIAFDGWRVWQNYLYICIEANEFDCAISAVKRLVEIKKDKKLDTDVLFLFLRVFKILLEKSPIPHGERLKSELADMFEHITNTISLDPHIWKAYSGYYEILADSIKDEDSEEKIKYLELAVEKRQKLVRSLQMSGWEREQSKFGFVAFSVSELVKLQIRVSSWYKQHNKEDKEVLHLSQAEDLLKSITKRSQEYFKNTEEFKELAELLEQVKKSLN